MNSSKPSWQMLCVKHMHSSLNQSLKIFSAQECTLYFPTTNRPMVLQSRQTMLEQQGVASVSSFYEHRGTKRSAGSFPAFYNVPLVERASSLKFRDHILNYSLQIKSCICLRMNYLWLKWVPLSREMGRGCSSERWDQLHMFISPL